MVPYLLKKRLLKFVIPGAVLAAAAAIAVCFHLCSRNGEASSVVLIVVDTLGAKHAGFFEKNLHHTPNLDRLAREGVSFFRAYSTSSWTKPAITSILTSRRPAGHGVEHVDGVIPASVPTLSEVLKSRGFRTAAFVSHTLLNSKHGFGRGFESYKIMRAGPVNDAITSHLVTNAGIKWLNELAGEDKPQRFFLFLHYFDPHFNYKRHPEFDLTEGYNGPLVGIDSVKTLRKMIPLIKPPDLKYMINLYHGEIAYTDFHIGRLLEYLRTSGLDKNTLLVFSADHGEEFLERDWIGHGRHLYDELIRVPLIFRHPALLGGATINSPVSILDIVPTVLEFLNLSDSRKSWDGQSLLGALSDESYAGSPRDIISEIHFDSTDQRRNAHKSSLIRGSLKVIHDRDKDSWELYDLVSDPLEHNNLAASMPSELGDISEEIMRAERVRVESSNREKVELDPKEVQRLKSLGYL